MAIILLQGSDYYDGVDGVRRQYGPGLFDTNNAGQIVGPHVDASLRSAGEQETAQSEQSGVQDAQPQQDASVASQAQNSAVNNNGG